MSEVSFDEESTLAPIPQVRSSQAALVGLVMRWGFAKDAKGAQTVLVGVVVAAVILAIAVPLLMREKEIPLVAPAAPLPTGSYAP
ncbi:MAG: hypothetical protein QG636_632 [Patescibacteria group bacterium]|nr:hypothetical protein [Patescibacteria group bacterium]